MRRRASEIIRDLEIRIARLEKSASSDFDFEEFGRAMAKIDPVQNAKNIDAFKVRLKGLISILGREKAHSLAKELQDIFETFGKKAGPKFVGAIKTSILHTIEDHSGIGLRFTNSNKISPVNFKGENLERTRSTLVTLLNYRLMK